MSSRVSNRVFPLASNAAAEDLYHRSDLCQPLLDRLNKGRDEAALDYLARETSLDVLSECVRKVHDQGLTAYLLEQVLLVGSLLSSAAFTAIENVRDELKALGLGASAADPKDILILYARRVEKLGKYFFALGRRLQQLEFFMESCPLTGSAEQLQGLYGQRVRDLAGDVRFMRQGLSRWVLRFVPLRRDPGSIEGLDLELIEGRIDAVVDELGLRLREVRDTLNTTIYEQLLVIDPSLKRKQLFRRDAENIVDVGHLLDWLGNVLDSAREFDDGRRPDQLDRVKTLLREFEPEHYVAFSGLRESDQDLFLRCIEDIESGENDPTQVLILLTGDFIATLRRQYLDAGEPS